MNTIILVGPPDRQKEPSCLCKRSDCSRCSQYVCHGAQALQFSLATMAWTPTQHPVHSTRGRTRMASVDLGQSGAPLPSTTQQLSPQITIATQHVLCSISPAKTGTVIIRCRQPVRVIVFTHYIRIIILLPCLRMKFYYIISAKCR